MKTTSKRTFTGRRRTVVAALASTALIGGLATVTTSAFADGHDSHSVSVTSRKTEDRPGTDPADPDRAATGVKAPAGSATSAKADPDRRKDGREPEAEHHRDADHKVVAPGVRVEARHDEPGDLDHRGDHDGRGGHHDGRDNDG